MSSTRFPGTCTARRSNSERARNKNFKIIELPNLNHLFQTAETGDISEYSKIEETISPAALQIIGDWILQQTESIRVR